MADDPKESWHEIDEGWDEVDVAASGKPKRRTRARGRTKRRTAGSPPVAQQPKRKKQKQKKARGHKGAAGGSRKRRAQAQQRNRPWLLPLVLFVVALGVIVLALIATSKK